MAPIVHIVLLAFKPEATPEQQRKLIDDLLALKDKCLHPKTNKPYMKVSRGGKDNSPEGLQGGLTHAFVMEFENEEDRHHYVFESQPHLDFKTAAVPFLSQVHVVDMTPGVF